MRGSYWRMDQERKVMNSERDVKDREAREGISEEGSRKGGYE